MDGLSQRGLTLPELLITLTVSAILIGYSIPSAFGLLAQAELGAQASQFLSSYQLARSQAIKTGRKVYLCSREQNSCSSAPQWRQGWIVFGDQNGNGLPESGEILKMQEPLPSNYQFAPNVQTAKLMFLNDGYVRKQNGSLPLMTFRLCSPKATLANAGRETRELVINGSGRPRLQYGRVGKTHCG